jgi:hypothetical protein
MFLSASVPLVVREDRKLSASADPARLESLVREFGRREEVGCTDDEIAVWLRFQTSSFGDSGKVLSVARGITTSEAYGAVHATSVWKNAATRFRLMNAAGFAGEFMSPTVACSPLAICCCCPAA